MFYQHVSDLWIIALPSPCMNSNAMRSHCEFLKAFQQTFWSRRYLPISLIPRHTWNYVVLARKLLRCIGSDESFKAALIGDKAELLADNRAELESVFVHSFLPLMAKQWKEMGDHLLQTYEYDKYEEETRPKCTYIWEI